MIGYKGGGGGGDYPPYVNSLSKNNEIYLPKKCDHGPVFSWWLPQELLPVDAVIFSASIGGVSAPGVGTMETWVKKSSQNLQNLVIFHL